MVAFRVQSVERDIGHVGEPGERMPIVRVGGRPRPEEPFQGQPFPDMWIFGHIRWVVVVDKFIIPPPPIKGQDDGGEGQENEKVEKGMLRSVYFLLPPPLGAKFTCHKSDFS